MYILRLLWAVSLFWVQVPLLDPCLWNNLWCRCTDTFYLKISFSRVQIHSWLVWWINGWEEELMYSSLYIVSPPSPSTFVRFLDHTEWHVTVGRTPGRVISSSQRPVPDNSQQTNIHAPGGIQTHNLGRQWAADRLRPRSHWDRRIVSLFRYFKQKIIIKRVNNISYLN